MNATDKKYREQLEHFEMKPSDRVWEQIEEALPEEEEERKVIWIYWAAAASIVLMFSLGWMSRDLAIEGQIQEQVAQTKTTDSEASDSDADASDEEKEHSTTSEEDETLTTDEQEKIGESPKALFASARNEKGVILGSPRSVAQLNTTEINQEVIDKRKKIKIDIEFKQSSSKTHMANADDPKMSVGDYAQKQWAALNTLNVKKLENPKGKVELPKIDTEPIKNLFNKRNAIN